ncbi:MAG: hypothetical protein OXI72_21570 [Gemmatimonadota bacterium]|nr:hypothetical protein [Gemmatimonadota bacterium]
MESAAATATVATTPEWWNVGTTVLAILAVIGAILKVGMWIDSVGGFRDDAKPVLNDIRDKVNQIVGKLSSPTMQSSSPLNLTDLGQSVSIELDAKEWASEKSKQVQNLVQGSRPYKIQRFCFDAVKRGNKEALGLPSDFIDDDMNAKIEDCAFNRGLSLQNIQDVLAIELRDAVLDLEGISIEHPDLDSG